MLHFASFGFLKKRLGASNQTLKMEVMNDVMEVLGMDTEGGKQVESVMNSSISLYEHTDDQPSAIQDEYYNLSNEESSLHVASPIYGGFEEVFQSSIV